MRLFSKLFFLCVVPVVSFSVNADLRDVFDTYKSVPASSFDGRQMQGVVGGSFHYRNTALYDREVFSVQAPSFGGGCGGIDLFAGAFSVITKDELVQMARGIAQGAPGYFFNMAIDTVCPNCGANMKELARRLNSYNELFSGSCEAAWDGLSNITGLTSLSESVKETTETMWPLLQQDTGIIPDFGTFMSNRSSEGAGGTGTPDSMSTAEAAQLFNKNYIFALFNDNADNYTENFATGLQPYEMFMSFIGNAIIIADAAKEVNQQPIQPSVNLKEFIYGRDGEETFDLELTRCQGPATDPDCLSPIASTITWEGLIPRWSKIISSGGATPGILQRMHRRENVSDEQKQWMLAYPYNYVDWARKCYIGAADSIAELVSRQVVLDSMNSFFFEIITEAKYLLYSAPKDEKNHINPEQILGIIKTFEDNLQTISDQLGKEIEDNTQTLTKQIAISSCGGDVI